MVATSLLSAFIVAISTLGAPPPPDPSWSAADAQIAADVRAGRPLVTYVVVPLCSNTQIDCGSVVAGRAGDPGHNIYWGAVFGARRFLDHKPGPWTRVDLQTSTGPILEQATYRRTISGSRWGLTSGNVEQIVVLQAVHGDQINDAVEHFWKVATEGGVIRFQDSGRVRSERIHVAGYVGHNRLMGGMNLPPPPDAAHRAPIHAFVLACYSESYFGPSLRAAGVRVLLTTRALMAPEGYLVDAVLRTVGDNGAVKGIRASAIDASVQWQKIARNDAAWIFAVEPRP
ncbi:MAG: hypothetical protein HY898_17380 [Deltaproteobacteria bacterium]|nr:hypothetical protein [Deltaproteobacteria bacterium]